MRCPCRYFIPAALLAALTQLAACSGGSKVVEDEDTDVTPPAVVSDLVALNATSTTVDLHWTAPSDTRDDGSGGLVDAYDLRLADAAITGANFAQALPVPGAPVPLPAGQWQHLSVTGLTPGTRYWFALKARDDRGNWSGLSDCPWADCRPVVAVSFPDPALEQAMRAHVHKPIGDLTTADVDTLHHLTAPALGIVSLEGLQYCTSLLSAQLRDNDIVDLTPVGGLENLGGLYLDGNQVSDLQPIHLLPSLRQLHLIGNPLASLAPLPSLIRLEQLTFSEQTITDFSPLCSLGYLRDLYLGAMNLDNIDFAVCLWHLSHLNLEINHIQSIEPLGLLTSLEALNLMDNGIVDIGPLDGLVNLRDLHLGRNLIVDLQPLVDNPGLGAGDVVRVNDNPLSVQAINVQIPALAARGVTVIR